MRRALNRLERLSLSVERPLVRLVRHPQFNPLYHTGTIALFALLIILFTGIYLTMFFPFGFADSYQAVARLESNLIGRLMRALHRYASALALLTALLHGWRTFFMDRFRGPRWLAWVTGIVLMVLVWGAGITGYWLIFDERAQLFNQALINLGAGFSAGVTFLNRFLLTDAAGQGWLFLLGIMTVHLGLSAAIGLLFYHHIRRLSRAKMLPPRYWMVTLGLLLLLASALVPVGMLPPADFARMPARVPLDLLLLFYLPALLNWSPALFWGGAAVLLALFSAVPWLLRSRPLLPVQVHADRCTGCTLCAADCPYKAISMVGREDASGHQLLAVVNPKLCVACGICVGSCPPLALTLADRPIEPLWQETVARAARADQRPVRVIFTCERHAQHGAQPYLQPAEALQFAGAARPGPSFPPKMSNPSRGVAGAPAPEIQIEVIPLTCIGMAHPDLASQALGAGAAEVQFVGCPPEDCANREGNLWLQERLDRTRLPKLKREFARAPIFTDWLAPNDFSQALGSGQASRRQSLATSYRPGLPSLSWRHMIPAVALLAVVLIVTVLLTGAPYPLEIGRQAILRIDLTHRSGLPVVASETDVIAASAADPTQIAATQLRVEIDGQIVLDKTYALRAGGAAPVQALEQAPLAVGEHRLRLLLVDRVAQITPQVILDKPISLAPGQILSIRLKDARLQADAEAGRALFNGQALGANTGCNICHALDANTRLVGPALGGVAARAAQRVPGMTAEAYLHQSIVDPNAYLVEGFPENQMPPNFAETLNQEQIDDLVAFLLTLE